MKKILLSVLLILSMLLSGCFGGPDAEPIEPQKEQSTTVQEIPEPITESVLEPNEEPPVSIETEATASISTIIVDSSQINVSTYNINDSNYIGIRDLAYILNGSRVNFDVGWDDATQAVTITSEQAYTPMGNELAGTEGGKVSAWSIMTPILVDGKETILGGYTIGNASCFSIKEIGKALNFSVGWSEELGQIIVNTEKPYGEEPLTLDEEYQLIINSCPLYDAGMEGLWEPVGGLVFADVIDQSLLLVSAEQSTGEFSGYRINIEVYTNNQGHAENRGLTTLDWISGERTIGLFKSNGKSYVGTYSHDGAYSYVYYGMDDTGLFEVDSFGGMDGWSDELNARVIDYYSGQKWDTAITEEEFITEVGKYTDEKTILSFDSILPLPLTVYTTGILQEPRGITVTVNGEEIAGLGNELFLENGYVMLPLRPVMEKAGVTVCANSKMDTILLTTKRNTLDIYDTLRFWWDKSGEYSMDFNGETLNIGGEAPSDQINPKMIDGQIWGPIKAIVIRFGGDVTFDVPTKTYSITLSIPVSERMELEEAQRIADFSFDEAEQIAKQQGYIFTAHPYDEWDCAQGFQNGKGYWWMCTLPENISADEAYSLYDAGIDYFEAVTVWSDGTITFGIG